MDLVCTIDDAYVRHCAVTLLTLRDANPTAELNVHLLHDGLEPAEAARLLRCLDGVLSRLTLIHLDTTPLRHFPLSHHVSLATYFRLLIPAALPAALDRVLFLDADTVVNDSLAELWSTNLEGRALGAVPSPGDELDRARLGLTAKEGYFNAGVMLIDLEAWRRRDLVAEGAALLRREPERILWWDQDVLNLAFRGDWLPLHARWNALPQWWLDARGRIDATRPLTPWSDGSEAPAIVHFAGAGDCKPWNHHCRHPHRFRYRSFAARTPWRGRPLDDAPSLLQRARAKVGPALRSFLHVLRPGR